MRLIPHRVKHWPLFWDLLILIAACAFAWCALALAAPWNACGALLLALLIYTCFIEPRIIVTKDIPVDLKTVRPLRIVFMSDFHVGPHKGKGFMRRLARKANELNPDLILLGGDFLYNYRSDPLLLEPFAELHAPLGVFGVMGNHDSGRDILGGRVTLTEDRTKDVEEVLDACGIVTLHNEWKDLGPIVLAGTDDVWMETYDLAEAFRGIPKGKPVVLLTHNPDAVLDERALEADLILSGHTHGGQVRLPLLGSVPPIPNAIGRKYDRGTFSLPNHTMLIVSHGVGESMARPRLLAPPEILLLVRD